MKCPNCLTLMKCITAINPVPDQPGRERMDLHCVKPIKIVNSDRWGRGCEIICHMGVITEDPKKWVCHDYNFEFKHNGKRFYLSGHDYIVDPVHQRFSRADERITTLSTNTGEIIKVDFIPISTGDDMHEKAWELFHRLRNLIIFS